MKRRTFLRTTALGSAALSMKPGSLLAGVKETNKPSVICTWNFGIVANAAAWLVLKDGGTARDAVEAGVKVPEADPKISSVGYGAIPDRDGIVTLDACIMDHNQNAGSV